MVLFFIDINQTQIYKIPYRDSSHDEIEKIMSFNYVNLFKPNEHTKDYHLWKPNYENFLFEIRDKKYIYAGEKVITFETNDIIVKQSLDIGFNNINFPNAYVEENFYFMLQ